MAAVARGRLACVKDGNGPHGCGPSRQGLVEAGLGSAASRPACAYSFAALRSSSALSVLSQEKAVAVWGLPSAPV